jgi:hypothetical protein
VHLRSLALLVFIFAASAAVAGYVGIMYDQHALKSAAPPPAPTTEREVQSLGNPLSSLICSGPRFFFETSHADRPAPRNCAHIDVECEFDFAEQAARSGLG